MSSVKLDFLPDGGIYLHFKGLNLDRRLTLQHSLLDAISPEDLVHGLRKYIRHLDKIGQLGDIDPVLDKLDLVLVKLHNARRDSKQSFKNCCPL